MEDSQGLYTAQFGLRNFHLSMNKEHENINLGQLLLRALYWFDDGLQNNLRRQFADVAVTHSQSMIIMSIGEGIQRPSAIAERIGVSRQAIHTSLNGLIQLGLVELVPDPEDRRAKIAVLSEQGEPIRRSARNLFAEMEQELGNRIGKSNVAALRKILEKDWQEPYVRTAIEQEPPHSK